MNIAIIGANGFIGKHLVNQLSENKEYKLFLFGKSDQSNFSENYSYSKINLNDSVELIQSLKDIDLVFFLASTSIPASSWGSPKSEIENNLLPFINFLESLVQLNVKKIIFASSAGTIYGSSSQKLNEDSNKKPFSPHGISKLTMEYFLNYFDVKYNLKYSIFRISNVYGEGQNTSKGLGIVNTFLEKIILDKEINVYGNGEIIRNYIYVKDVAKILSFSCYSNFDTSDIYNLSSDDSFSINDVIYKIQNIVKEDFKINYKESRHSDNPKILLDNSKLKIDFKGLKFTSFGEGIRNTYLNLLNTL